MKPSAKLLLFIALLLPFRDALAVSGWLCYVDSALTVVMAAHGTRSTAVATADMNQAADHANCHGSEDQDGQASIHLPSCNVCSSICGAPAYPSADAQYRGLPPPGAERFMAIVAPRAEFALGGLERPPRTI